MLSENDNEQLKKMIDINNVEDQTTQIRDTKHSAQIRSSILDLLALKRDNADLLKTNKEDFEALAVNKCKFLFFNYMELYNIIVKENMDPTIMFQLLDVLKQIEDGEYNQHEGSFKVGKLLKEIYVDSKLSEAKRLDDKYQPIEFIEPKKITWKEYSNKNIK